MMYQKTKLQTKKGATQKNRSRLYLAPLLKLYGKRYTQTLINNNILGFAIADYHKSKDIENSIFVKFDINGKMKLGNYMDSTEGRKLFSESLGYFKLHSSFKQEYSVNSNEHIIEFSLPHNIIDLFLQGKYSEIYKDEKRLEVLKKINIKNIVQKTNESFELFKNVVYEDFNVEIENDGRECDYPPIISQEIFNYE